MSISSTSAGIISTAEDACTVVNALRALAGDILKIGGPRIAFIFSRNALVVGSIVFSEIVVSVLIGNPLLQLI
jgi:hypothetical protein